VKAPDGCHRSFRGKETGKVFVQRGTLTGAKGLRGKVAIHKAAARKKRFSTAVSGGRKGKRNGEKSNRAVQDNEM